MAELRTRPGAQTGLVGLAQACVALRLASRAPDSAAPQHAPAAPAAPRVNPPHPFPTPGRARQTPNLNPEP
jgi:hypothetical protein